MRRLTLLCALTIACAPAKDEPAGAADSVATPSAARSAAPVSGADTLRGLLELSVTATDTSLVLRKGDGVYTLSSADDESLRRATGLEIVVRGSRTGTTGFDVATFAVRAANGEPAVDGILDIGNGVFFLQLQDGQRVSIANLPVPLRGEIGSRVYVAGPLDGALTAFGVIAPSGRSP